MPDDYGVSPEKESPPIDPPSVEHSLPAPKRAGDYPIGLVGAGSISEYHLSAYRTAGYSVVAIADKTLSKAEARRDEFFPEARATDDYRDLLQDEAIAIVDLTPHPADRAPLIREALEAGKHVLSQKPLATSVADARELSRLAANHDTHLAVNQNGRWAPHFLYLRRAVANGVIGKVHSVDFQLQWDQTWVAGIEYFECLHHLILSDFAIHWFDITSCLLGTATPERIYASARKFSGQRFQPPALAAAIIDYPDAQVRMAFNAHTCLGEEDCTTVIGSSGTIRTRGRSLNEQPQIELFLPEGHSVIPLQGCWFENGFAGAMGELICAIEEGRQPEHNAENNLRSLALCEAALKSADQGAPVCPGA
jgi:predicted dehydrogenase